MVVKYGTVKIPLDLLKEVKKFIEKNKHLGYRSRSEVCINAIRKFINSK